MTVLDAIKGRRSVRSYSDRSVEPEKLKMVLEAGRLAPSATNQQHWKFTVVTDEKLRFRMVEACCNQKFVGEAPAIIVVSATSMRSMTCGQPSETIDCSIALSFMMLEAYEQGLGTCWLGAFFADKVKEVLDLSEAFIPVAVTPIGYPLDWPEVRGRKATEEVVEYK